MAGGRLNGPSAEGSTQAGPPPGALSIITLGVQDVERAAAFYRALGWPHASSSQPGIIHWFDLSGVWLGLFERAALAADSGLDAAPPSGPGQFTGVTLAINLADRPAVDDALRRAVAAGATVTLAPQATSYGVYHACYADPDGQVWEVAHNPAFPIVEGRTVIP